MAGKGANCQHRFCFRTHKKAQERINSTKLSLGPYIYTRAYSCTHTQCAHKRMCTCKNYIIVKKTVECCGEMAKGLRNIRTPSSVPNTHTESVPTACNFCSREFDSFSCALQVPAHLCTYIHKQNKTLHKLKRRPRGQELLLLFLRTTRVRSQPSQ